jgi:AraC-like DNA-binding protein
MASAPQTQLTDLRVRQALVFIQSNYPDSNLSLRRTAEWVRLSPFHLCRRLKSATGMGFTGQLRCCRIKAAERLLHSGDLSVKEIAAAVGYRNTNALDRNFKMVHGMCPVGFRQHALVLQQGSSHSLGVSDQAVDVSSNELRRGQARPIDA